ncbi:F-box/FBD/LRR-repeat protein [Striga hermonthica]|uniref:F-box/FBD/LRR-repeat protein n=1 Tax=Striga hermonthica TaxID=68872 RepID=A0A9N7MHC2_STRHE|nr:F-box/FBD/LRR-repeat protein [Striga hermonthica]
MNHESLSHLQPSHQPSFLPTSERWLPAPSSSLRDSFPSSTRLRPPIERKETSATITFASLVASVQVIADGGMNSLWQCGGGGCVRWSAEAGDEVGATVWASIGQAGHASTSGLVAGRRQILWPTVIGRMRCLLSELLGCSSCNDVCDHFPSSSLDNLMSCGSPRSAMLLGAYTNGTNVGSGCTWTENMTSWVVWASDRIVDLATHDARPEDLHCPRRQTCQMCVERYRGDNLISRLPDDILLVILSFLTLKEAGRTSVLSSRWRNLWSYTLHLNFEDHSSMEKIVWDSEFRGASVEREKYVKWVDSVLQSHRGSTVKELRIRFSLVKSARKSITKWLEFAFERHTEKLELNLSDGDCGQAAAESYVFPQELCGNINCKSIKMLHLGSIQVSGETIEFLLRGCPLLEQLILRSSKCLTRLEELLWMIKFPMMPKLKKLVIIEGLLGVDSSLLGLANFISASPNLQEFEIRVGLCIYYPCYLQSWFKPDMSNNEIQKGLKHFPLHQNLNVFRFLGYYGCPSDVELVNYLLENCVALKEIIVDTKTQLRVAYEPLDSEQLEWAEIAKGYAKQQLEPLVPNHISLFIC